MATDNPKVSGYVPQAVYDQLMAFKAERNLKSVSMAVIAVLEEYFGLSQVGAAPDATASRLETLEGKVASLTETVAALNQAMLLQSRCANADIQASSGLTVDNSNPPDTTAVSSSHLPDSKPQAPSNPPATTADSLLIEYSNSLVKSESPEQLDIIGLPVPHSELAADATIPPVIARSKPLTESDPLKLTAAHDLPVTPSTPPLDSEPLNRPVVSSSTADKSTPQQDNEPLEQTAASTPQVSESELPELTPTGVQAAGKPPSPASSELPLQSDSEPAPLQSDSVVSDGSEEKLPTSEPRSQPSIEPLTQAALAKRLGVDKSRVSRRQSQPNFSKWSQERDPDGIAWQFNPKTKRFYPQTNE